MWIVCRTGMAWCDCIHRVSGHLSTTSANPEMGVDLIQAANATMKSPIEGITEMTLPYLNVLSREPWSRNPDTFNTHREGVAPRDRNHARRVLARPCIQTACAQRKPRLAW